MTISRVAAATCGLLAVGHPASAQNRCEHRETRELELPADGIDRLDLEAGSGSLTIEGREGVRTVTVHATLCASEEELLAALGVRLDRSGSRAVVDTRFPDWGNRGGRNSYARIDLVVEVPRGLAADITDGSGETEVSGTGTLTVEDGSGSLFIRDIDGDVRVQDGSGEVEIRQIEGDVDVEDGSGGVTVEAVGGGVTLEDGSGGVEIRDVALSVEVTDKGSGQIDVEDVRGDLRVRGTRRERIHHANVAGAVDLPPARERGRRGRRGG